MPVAEKEAGVVAAAAAHASRQKEIHALRCHLSYLSRALRSSTSDARRNNEGRR